MAIERDIPFMMMRISGARCGNAFARRAVAGRASKRYGVVCTAGIDPSLVLGKASLDNLVRTCFSASATLEW